MGSAVLLSESATPSSARGGRGVPKAVNVVWGPACGGLDCQHPWTGEAVWGTTDEGDTVVWGTADEGDTVVWGRPRRRHGRVGHDGWGGHRRVGHELHRSRLRADDLEDSIACCGPRASHRASDPLA